LCCLFIYCRNATGVVWFKRNINYTNFYSLLLLVNFLRDFSSIENRILYLMEFWYKFSSQFKVISLLFLKGDDLRVVRERKNCFHFIFSLYKMIFHSGYTCANSSSLTTGITRRNFTLEISFPLKNEKMWEMRCLWS
jgi:hypothetical protein